MKLNDFVNKKRVRQATSSPRFILDNSALESKYKDQISDLNTQLGAYRTMEADRDAAIRRLGVEVDKKETLESQNNTFKDELQRLRITISDQEKFLNQIPDLKKEIHRLTVIEGDSKQIHFNNSSLLQEITALKSTIQNQETKLQTLNELQEAKTAAENFLADTKEELEQITNTAFGTSGRLTALEREFDLVKRDNNTLSKELIQNRADKISAEEERKQVLEENKKLKTFADETSKISIEVQKHNNKLRDEINFWEQDSKNVSEQLEESIQIENKLRKWITDLENQDTKNTSIKGGLNKNLESLRSTVSEMGTFIDGLMTDNTYLRRVNSDFRKELLKPKYLSMGAIAKREGFKMPQGMENIRTRNLGNSAPTLLKFNPKKENSYGN